MTQAREELALAPQHEFAEFEQALNGQASTLLHEFRRKAIADFEAHGFPTNKLEEWKYFDCKGFKYFSYFPTETSRNEKLISNIEECIAEVKADYCVVLINGKLSQEYSKLPKNGKFVVTSLAQATNSHAQALKTHLGRYLATNNAALASLNLAYLMDGALIILPKGVDAGTVHIVHVNDLAPGKAASFRALVMVGENAHINLVESFLGSPKALLNSACEIVLGKSATCRHLRVVDGDETSWCLGHVGIGQNENSQYKLHIFSLGGSTVRNSIKCSLDGEHASCEIYGLDLGQSNQLLDTECIIEHAHPYCTSKQLAKGVYAGTSKGVFNGCIVVPKGAIKTSASQTSRNLLLSENATVNTRPQLKIFADDVKCTHGATVGQLEEEQLFYLCARGIETHEAKRMLTFAFAKEILDTLDDIAMREKLESKMRLWLSNCIKELS